jgi:hypothetical protein
VNKPEDTVATGQAQVADLQRRLRQLADLLSEYGELADRTDKADLTALVFQARLALGDDHAEFGTAQ